MQRRMVWAVVLTAGMAAVSSHPALSQSADDPALKHRDSTAGQVPVAKQKVGVSTLPDDASGEFEIDGRGSTVEITLEKSRVSGYVTKMGDEGSDKDVPVTFFFTEATVSGHRITFSTKKVHGRWFSFEGTIERGDPQTPRDQNGYYRLLGTWTTHEDVGNQQFHEQVSYKSTPRTGDDR
ncbi:hypothetical protein [Silvibacterium dinghuense]|uniref:Uncharacterized protein n=1 Tax=Silvibacterium dinghuense TaxID=1560006 RepID=A0A4Q1SKG3_9BACT|nr:hypothetical protein [Silvibacterium dinghuense]RXS97957.1 hypothetical protein ESZ00_08920 [Silvibacterium dinghuense]GGH03341.1 hypothetical protein GCM10011586_19090 [Silvibacterium dinghuense]